MVAEIVEEFIIFFLSQQPTINTRESILHTHICMPVNAQLSNQRLEKIVAETSKETMDLLSYKFTFVGVFFKLRNASKFIEIEFYFQDFDLILGIGKLNFI